MRKILGVSLTALSLLFGGAGVAHATETAAPVPAATIPGCGAWQVCSGCSDWLA